MACSSDSRTSFLIGGHILEIEASGEPEVLGCIRSIPGFDVFECPGSGFPGRETLGTIDFGHDIDARPFPEPSYSIEADGYKSSWTLADGRGLFRMSGEKMTRDLLLNFDFTGTVLADATSDPEALRFALWFAFNLLGSAHGLFGVHSSCIVHRGEAVMFLGESGTGKSTHSRLWTGNIEDCFLLNDDSPVVSSGHGKPLVSGSPWSGKTACFRQEEYPLKAVVRLVRARENGMRRLGTLEALAALYPSYPPAFTTNPVLRDRVVKAVSGIISEVPVYSLECLPDRAAAELCHGTIFTDG